MSQMARAGSYVSGAPYLRTAKGTKSDNSLNTARVALDIGRCRVMLTVMVRGSDGCTSPTFAILISHFLFAVRPSRVNAGLGFSFHFEYAT